MLVSLTEMRDDDAGGDDETPHRDVMGSAREAAR